MSLVRDFKTVLHLTLSPIRGRTHAERLESFYGKQAGDYDDFRKRLLQGRHTLFTQLQPTVQPGSVWVDLGAGTGSNVEEFAAINDRFSRIYLVDLSASLLARAEQRVADRGWSNIKTVETDATTFTPEEGEGGVDLVTFSYSLTMIPDWFAAIDNAVRLLKPGGRIGVVDFYVGRKYPEEAHRRHGWWTRSFWPIWFGMDNVFLNPDHVPYLSRHFEPVAFSEHWGKVPFLWGFRVPYYLFEGRKRQS